MLQLLSAYFLLKREPIYFPRRMDYLWHLAMEHQTFHPAVPDTDTQTHGGGGKGWRGLHRSFDRLSRLTYNCLILMCNHSHPPIFWCQCTCTHKNTCTHSENCCVPISSCINSSKKMLVLLLSVLLHLVEWPPQYLLYSQELFLNASQSNGLFCQKLLGNDPFSPWKHGLQGCPVESQSTYERLPIHCIVLAKWILYSVRMRHNYISFIWCIGNCRAN